MKKLQQGKKKLQKGFTLIELMIVVAVIGVLAAIAIPQYQNYVKKAALGSALATATALKTNVEDNIAVNGSFPTGAAISFSIGTINYGSSTTGGTTSAAGSILAILDNGPAKTAGITLSRNDSGVWSCKVVSGSVDLTNVEINGCP